MLDGATAIANLAADHCGVDELLAQLTDSSTPPDERLPNRQQRDIEFERRVAPCFIVGDDYGTRASGAVILNGHIYFSEQTYLAGQVGGQESTSTSTTPDPTAGARLMDTSLTAKTALITGGSLGLELAVAKHFYGAGANVAILARRPEPLVEVVAEITAQDGDGEVFIYLVSPTPTLSLPPRRQWSNDSAKWIFW